MPDPTYIFGIAFVLLALVGVYGIFRAMTNRAGGGPHGRKTTLGERGRTDVGSPLFPPPPEVVTEPDRPHREGHLGGSGHHDGDAHAPHDHNDSAPDFSGPDDAGGGADTSSGSDSGSSGDSGSSDSH